MLSMSRLCQIAWSRYLSKSQIGIEPEPADFGGIEGKNLEFLFTSDIHDDVMNVGKTI